jgi:hypothetical protein
MASNAIILTSGLSGSSVLTGLISRAGYWTGDHTYKKTDYDTHENTELIELNTGLFRKAGYGGNYLMEFSREAVDQIAGLYPRIDCSEYRSFVEKCNRHQPWIWKDPRLWMTIRFWNHLLDREQCRFILLTRGPVQSWISSTLRRQIVTYRYKKNYEAGIQAGITAFLEENRLPYLQLSYEDLIQRPDTSIDALNRHLSMQLSVDDLRATYHGPLYKNPRASFSKHVKALLIYAKNYHERLDVAPQSE